MTLLLLLGSKGLKGRVLIRCLRWVGWEGWAWGIF